MTGGRGALLLAGVAVVASAAGMAIASGGGAAPAAPVHGPGEVTVRLDIEHSRFRPATVTVRAGTVVRFELRNGDPIAHELVVGPPEVHARHERGTEPRHPPVPGEASVAPGGRATTAYVFDRPGEVRFACHLPGHLAYGMVGTVVVVPG